jgi:carbonic anhydrase
MALRLPLSRRALLQAAGLLLGGAALESPAPARADTSAEVTIPMAPLDRRLAICTPPGDPLQELLRRNRAFSEAWQAAVRTADPTERGRLIRTAAPLPCQIHPTDLVEGQKPWAAVLCCADSRVAPEWIFASGPGELFEVRSAGNTAFREGIASLEYAVAELDVPLILVMGHSGCGAVTAAMGSDPLSPLLEELVTPIRASLSPGADLSQAIRENAAAAAQGLIDGSALLRKAAVERHLIIRAATFDIATGRVTLV